MAHALSLYSDPQDRHVDVDAVRGAIVTRPAFHDQAACRGLGAAQFYAAGNTRATRHAMSICAGCPVVDECRQAGADESFGVWGGERAVHKPCTNRV